MWHADEVTYAVTAPIETLWDPGGVLPADPRDDRRGADGRSASPPDLASPPGRASALDAGACFASPAGGEVMLPGGKVVGSAQLREGGAFLQHGSILLADPSNW